MRFEFATATRIVFGAGVLREAGPLARDLGSHALVATGRDCRRAQPLLTLLHEHGLAASVFSVPGEPELDTIRHGANLAREKACDLVIGFGGGSAIDAGKAIAAMLTNDGDLLDYVEIIGRGRALARPSAPFIAIPTTAGTGSEVTRNSVLASPEHRLKVSLRSPLMLPRIALVDPALTCDLPPALTASTGLDALTQLIEPYTCSRANPMTDALCVEGIRRAGRSLRAAFADGGNAAAREDMSVASLFGGMALANAGLGAAHGFRRSHRGHVSGAARRDLRRLASPCHGNQSPRPPEARFHQPVPSALRRSRKTPGQFQRRQTGGRRCLDTEARHRSSDSASAHLWRYRGEHFRTGWQSPQRQQHEGESHCADR